MQLHALLRYPLKAISIPHTIDQNDTDVVDQQQPILERNSAHIRDGNQAPAYNHNVTHIIISDRLYRHAVSRIVSVSAKTNQYFSNDTDVVDQQHLVLNRISTNIRKANQAPAYNHNVTYMTISCRSYGHAIACIATVSAESNQYSAYDRSQ